MRLAVVSDIHGSLYALRAVVADLVRTAPDAVFHGGDLAVNGPYPDEVVAIVREQKWKGVVGNTDEMLWRLDDLPRQFERMPRLRPILRVLYEHTAPAALERLTDDNLAWLRALPKRMTYADLTLLHASPHDLWRAPLPDADDHELAQTYADLGTPLIVYGHVHRPFVREVGGITVANSGSAGLTWDGDPRASYLVIEEGAVTIRRVEYDIEAEVAALVQTNHPYAQWLGQMRRRGSFIRPDGLDLP